MSASKYIYGKNSVKALLEANPERVYKIFLSDTLKPDKRVQAIVEHSNNRRIPIQKVPRQKLDQMMRPEAGQEHADMEEANHQGVIASVAPKALLDIHGLIKLAKAKEAETGKHPRLLMLDGVTDPRNFGAILRVADAAGLDGVIVPKHNSAGFGPAVSKTASGAEETVDIAVVSNLNQALEQLKKENFWIVGAAGDESGAQDYHKMDYKMATVLVMGSEDKGISPLTRKNCDFLVKIPMHGTVDSLNVSTATAVILFEMVK
jgi:23S rRNA (guanosine2251-2'-O)-methyltransferase